LLRKSVILAISIVIACLGVSCGKKGNPIPKGLPIPQDIKDLRGNVRDGVLFLSFAIPTKNQDGTDVTILEGFKVMKSCRACIGGLEMLKNIRLTDTRGFTVRDGKFYTYDNDLRAGFDYTYQVVPYTKTGTDLQPSNAYSIRWEAVPPPPSGVSVKEGDGSLILSWAKENGYLYNVYRLEGDAYPLFPLNPGPLQAATFTAGGLENAKTYVHEVRAVRMSGTIAFEGEGTAVKGAPVDKTPPAPPREFMAEKRNETVRLSWAANGEADLRGYFVYRVVSGKPERLQKDPTRETSFVDQSPGPHRYVAYYVTAVDVLGNESAPSREQIIMLRD
jgi:hypothetical protein